MCVECSHTSSNLPAPASLQAATAHGIGEEVFVPGSGKAREWLRRPSDGSLSVRLKQHDTYNGALPLRGECGCNMGGRANASMKWSCLGAAPVELYLATLSRFWGGSCMPWQLHQASSNSSLTAHKLSIARTSTAQHSTTFYPAMRKPPFPSQFLWWKRWGLRARRARNSRCCYQRLAGRAGPGGWWPTGAILPQHLCASCW